MFCAYARDTGSIEDQPKESRKWEFIRTISDLVAHTHTHIYVFSQLKLQKLWEKSYNYSIKGLKSKYILTAQPSFSSWRIKFLSCAYVINCKNAKTLLSFCQ